MPNPSNSDLVGEARRLSEAATPGPWRVGIDKNGVPWLEWPSDRGWLPVLMADFDVDVDDAEFIARARTLLPELAQQLEQAERDLERSLEQETEAHKRVERYREALEEVRGRFDAYTKSDVNDKFKGACSEGLSIIDAALTPDEGTDPPEEEEG